MNSVLTISHPHFIATNATFATFATFTPRLHRLCNLDYNLQIITDALITKIEILRFAIG